MNDSFRNKVKNSLNPKFLKEATKLSIGQSLKYLALLLLVVTLLLSVRYTIVFNQGVKSFAQEALIFWENTKDVPEIVVEEGMVTSPKEKFVKGNNKAVFVIDINGGVDQYLTLLDEYEEGGFIVLEEKVLSKSEEGKVEINDIPSEISYLKISFDEEGKLFNLTFEDKSYQPTPADMNHWLNIISWIFFPICFSVLFLAFWLAKVYQVLFLSIFSLIINKVNRVGLRYSDLFKLGVFALTLPIIMELIVKLLGINIPYFGWIYFIIYAVYLSIGISSCRSEIVKNHENNQGQDYGNQK